MKVNNYLISVIVPVYNVEKYLEECLNSLVNQSFKSYEIILVDDGSTDKSGKICDCYKELHSNVTVIHKTNRGLSSARNAGVKISKGLYLTFVDSDDFVSSDYLEFLYNNLVLYKADISIGRMRMFWKKINITIPKESSVSIYTPSQALKEMMLRRNFGVTACCKLCKKELVCDYTEGKLYEDLDTTYKIIGKSNKVVYGNKPIYFYRQRLLSIRHTYINDKHLYGIDAAEHQMEYIKKNYPDLINYAGYRVALIIFELISKTTKYSSYNIKMFKKLKIKLERYSYYVINTPEVHLSMKLRCLAVRSGYIASYVIFSLLDTLAKIKVIIKK